LCAGATMAFSITVDVTVSVSLSIDSLPVTTLVRGR
jgi:hypothetical protein